MSSLSEEDKKKIEANRLKAKAIRDQKNQTETLNLKPFDYNKPFPVFAAGKSNVTQPSTSKQTHPNLTSIKSPQKFGAKSKTTKAKCILISRDRFEVQAQYHKELVDLCRNTDTSVYNATTKRWDFHLKVYNSFIKKAKDLKNKIEVDGLPSIITSTFANVIATGQIRSAEIPSYDLRNVDKTLLDCLFPFQLDAINFVISKNGRGLIADDMGVGKTLEALGVASYYRDEWPLLIITPASVRHTWVEAIKKFYSTNTIHPDDIFSPDSRKDCIFPSSSKYITIVSYDLMKSQHEVLCQKMFRVVIIDESHYIKDFTSARCKLTTKLVKNAKRVVLLSGTPALSRPVELYPQLRVINPVLFQNYAEFAYRYCDAKKRPDKFGGGLDASGNSNLEELEIFLKETIMIRRLKDTVMSQLQPKRRSVYFLDQSLISLGDREFNSAKSRFLKENQNSQKHGALLAFYHETAKAKIAAVLKHVLTLINDGRKLVIFAHHQLMMEELQKSICEANILMIKIDGATPSKDRQKYCDKFQTNDEIKVALLSITAASAGLTLTSASLVVFAELFWNPGILVQAEDRVHRVGQEADVEVQYLVAQGTADDDLWRLVKKKLKVLGKGGLSKDNFEDVDTFDDPSNSKETNNQKTLDDFWEEISNETLQPSKQANNVDFWNDLDNIDFDTIENNIDVDEKSEPKMKKFKEISL